MKNSYSRHGIWFFKTFSLCISAHTNLTIVTSHASNFIWLAKIKLNNIAIIKILKFNLNCLIKANLEVKVT